MTKIRKAVGIGLMVAAGAAGVTSQAAEVVGCEGEMDYLGDLYNPHCVGEIEGIALPIHETSKIITIGGIALGSSLLVLEHRKKEEESPILQEENA